MSRSIAHLHHIRMRDILKTFKGWHICLFARSFAERFEWDMFWRWSMSGCRLQSHLQLGSNKMWVEDFQDWKCYSFVVAFIIRYVRGTYRTTRLQSSPNALQIFHSESDVTLSLYERVMTRSEHRHEICMKSGFWILSWSSRPSSLLKVFSCTIIGGTSWP